MQCCTFLKLSMCALSLPPIFWKWDKRRHKEGTSSSNSSLNAQQWETNPPSPSEELEMTLRWAIPPAQISLEVSTQPKCLCLGLKFSRDEKSGVAKCQGLHITRKTSGVHAKGQQSSWINAASANLQCEASRLCRLGFLASVFHLNCFCTYKRPELSPVLWGHVFHLVFGCTAWAVGSSCRKMWLGKFLTQGTTEEEFTGELNSWGALRLKDDLYLLLRTMGLGVQSSRVQIFLKSLVQKRQVSFSSPTLARVVLLSLDSG